MLKTHYSFATVYTTLLLYWVIVKIFSDDEIFHNNYSSWGENISLTTYQIRRQNYILLYDRLKCCRCVCVRTFIMPFQLSPVATRNNVRNAMPKLRKWACLSSPSHGCFSEHSASQNNHHITDAVYIYTVPQNNVRYFVFHNLQKPEPIS